MRAHIPAVIFAGGKSSRMGEDKALLPFGDAPSLIQYQYHKLSGMFDSVFLSAKEDKSAGEITLIPDRYSIFSPLSGIVSIFETLTEDEVFILSVDTPFVDMEIIEKILREEGEGYDAIIAKCRGKVQPLCGCYRRSILPLAKAALKKGDHKLGMLLEQAHTCYVDFHEEERFMNLNHPAEYKKALLLHKA